MKKNLPKLYSCNVGIIGLGYVGLPLAVEVAKNKKCVLSGKSTNRKVIGFDINKKRIKELQSGFDNTKEVDSLELQNLKEIEFTSDYKKLLFTEVFLVTVPTPIDSFKKPDLSLIKKANSIISKILNERKNQNIENRVQFLNKQSTCPVIIYESTVFPGVTEEICAKQIQVETGLQFNKEFFCGYSPERINPGDQKHRLTSIVKITSGSCDETSKWVSMFYGSIIDAGIYEAPTIKVAEAAKVIENAQRDINIAFVNELSIIFSNLGLDTLDILKAAETKWNFLPFKPGLVGGHCIGVDPYYLTSKSEIEGYRPKVLLSGREINDSMGKLIVERIIKNMVLKGMNIKDSKVLILGLTFKENCPDIRNTKVLDILKTFEEYQVNCDVVDPHLSFFNLSKELKLKINCFKSCPKKGDYSAVILAVAHKEFLEISLNNWGELIKIDGLFFDIKGIIPRELNPIRI